MLVRLMDGTEGKTMGGFFGLGVSMMGVSN